MATDAAGRDTRRRPWNFVIVAVAMLAVGVASASASVIYANSAASAQRGQARTQAATIARLDAQARKQDAIIAQLRRQQLAGCSATADLGTVPLPAKPPPGRFAVRIVTDNRAQWYGLGCPGILPVPPGLAQAAARWGIPVDGQAPHGK